MKNLMLISILMLIAMAILHSFITYSIGQAESSDKSVKRLSQVEEESKILLPDQTMGDLKFNFNQDILKSNIYSNPQFILWDNESGIGSIAVRYFWQDPYQSCNFSFNCTANTSTGWKSKNSFQLSTSNNTNNTWSSMNGGEIDVTPNKQIKLVNHMKLNEWATQSHVVLEGYNETSKQWYQITHCPSGTNGPLEWKEFSCLVTIPANTTKIREVLNAGWSSQPNKKAMTWFDSFYMLKHGHSQIIQEFQTENSKFDAAQIIAEINAYSNPRFLRLDNQSHMISIGLASFWNDSYSVCNTIFKCVSDSATSRSKNSFQLSTSNNTNNTWSSMKGGEIAVEPSEWYELITNMKLNEWATQSHVSLEGYNESSRQWYQITQCPYGVNGPLEWKQFSCTITVPENTTKIRPVLNAGWSSQPNQEATTWFDSFYVTKLSIVTDPKLKAEAVSTELRFPTGMAFLDRNDILVLEKNEGKVQRIVNGAKLKEPLLDLGVRENDGLLAMAMEKNTMTNQNGIVPTAYVFLYFTAAQNESKDETVGEGASLNHLYRYELVDNKLVNPKLLQDIPAAFIHNGGKILVGPDKYIYLSVGELTSKNISDPKNKALNYAEKDGNEPDGRGSILWMDHNGLTPRDRILGENEPLNKYYAYGIRNSFGMDFDPVTGKLWDTENGPEWGDEINLVQPGFNSGWNKIQGIWSANKNEKKGEIAPIIPKDLVDFDGRGKYSSPEFIWNHSVGVTDLKFLSSTKLGKQYQNDMFVGDVNHNRIYHFDLNQNRTGLLLKSPLEDKIADTDRELKDVIFAQGFGGIVTDLEVGPDGYLYVVAGKIFRIVPGDQKEGFLTAVEDILRNGIFMD